MGDGSELTVGEVARRLNVSDTAVRNYVASDLLRARWTGGGHTRVEAKSVDELVPLLLIHVKKDRDAALDRLRASNRERREAPAAD